MTDSETREMADTKTIEMADTKTLKLADTPPQVAMYDNEDIINYKHYETAMGKHRRELNRENKREHEDFMMAAPKKLRRQDSQIALVGKTQRFECQVLGYPPPTITWFKDGQDITSNERYTIGYDPVRGVITLNIKDVQHADEGCYQCRAENAEGHATTTAYLIVREGHTVLEEVITRVEEREEEIFEHTVIPPKITFGPEVEAGLALREGASLYIEVDIHGQPTPTVTWYHKDTKLDDNARTTIETMRDFSILKVKGVGVRDGGAYQVRAHNIAGTAQATFEVLVKSGPAPPSNLTLKEVFKDYVVLQWEPPYNDGGEPIIGYQIEKSLEGGPWCSAGYVKEDELEFKVVKLHENSDYRFQVIGENKLGLGQPSTTATIHVKMPGDTPVPPGNLRVTEFNKDYLVVCWDPPDGDLQYPITQYIIEKCDMARGTGKWIHVGNSLDCTFRVNKLIEGNDYLIRVMGENKVGVGAAACLAKPQRAKIPHDPPGIPLNLHLIEQTKESITIGWAPPADDGGSAITGYCVSKRDAKRDMYVNIAEITSATFEYQATRLFEGYDYYFRVQAENDAGKGKPAEFDKPITAKLPFDPPSPPMNLRIDEYWRDYITIAWDAPENDGGAHVTSYVIERRDAMRTSWVLVGSCKFNEFTFKNDQNIHEGDDYFYRVYAENRVGRGKFVELIDPVKARLPFELPGEPLHLRAGEVWADHIRLDWLPPHSDGGSPLTGYSIYQHNCRESQRDWKFLGEVDTATNSFTAKDLLNGQDYVFRVFAHNLGGAGKCPAENREPIKAKYPFDLPLPPNDVAPKEVRLNSVLLKWGDSEDDGGSPITSWIIQCRNTKAADDRYKDVGVVDGHIREFWVKGLREGNPYEFAVKSENLAGISKDHSMMPGEVIPHAAISEPPINFSIADMVRDHITLFWEYPTWDGGADVTRYDVFVKRHHDDETQEGDWVEVGHVEGDVFSFRVGMLCEGQPYQFGVKAVNGEGSSKLGIMEEIIIPIDVPTSPQNLTLLDLRHNSMDLSWDAPESLGGKILLKYNVCVRENSDAPWIKKTVVPASKTMGTISGLVECTMYEVAVFAENELGESQIGLEWDSPIETPFLAIIPKILNKPEDVFVKEGEMLIIPCTIIGKPEPEVAWGKDGQDLTMAQDDRILMERELGAEDNMYIYSLKISDTIPSDAGKYSLTMVNESGRCMAHTEVAVMIKPKFVERPMAEVITTEFQNITISCKILAVPEAVLSYRCNGQLVKEDVSRKITKKDDSHTIQLVPASLLDHGEWTLSASNEEGTTDANFKLIVNEKLFEEWPMLCDFIDEARGVYLQRGDIVQVMDTSNPRQWLIRKKDNKQWVTHIPVDLVKDFHVAQNWYGPAEYPIRMAVMDYEPGDSEKGHLILRTEDKVEVMDSSNGDLWLCRLVGEEKKFGWVPPYCLMHPCSDDKRAFREDVIKVGDRKQEANMKRKLTLNELWESERDYIQEMKFTVDNYYKKFSQPDMLPELKGKQEDVFQTMPYLFPFHRDTFLSELMTVKDSHTLGKCFLDHKSEFQDYVEYLVERQRVDHMLNLPGPEAYWKKFDTEIENVGEYKRGLRGHLCAPDERLDQYVRLLQDYLRYSVQVEDDSYTLRDAIEMLLSLRREADTKLLLKNILGYPGDVNDLGPLIRHDTFLAWEREADTKGKEHHLFLFNDHLLITHRRRPVAGLPPVFEFVADIKIPDPQLTENSDPENARRFELWFPDDERDKWIFQASTLPIKQAWCDALRFMLRQHGVEIEEAPSFAAFLPENMETVEGEQMMMSCSVLGFPKPEVRWYRQRPDFPIEEITKANIEYTFDSTSDGTYILTISSAQLECMAEYTSVATNRAGEVKTKCNLVVELCGVLPKFPSGCKDQSCIIGGDAEFEVIISGQPPPEVKWFFNNKELVKDLNHKFQSDLTGRHTLSIIDTKLTDDGTYRCVARNRMGMARSHGHLAIHEDRWMPRFTAKFTDMEVVKGSMTELIVEIDAKPEATVTWTRNRKPVIEDPDRLWVCHRGNTYRLVISSVETFDQGMYTVTAENENGKATCSANLHLLSEMKRASLIEMEYKPGFIKSLNDEDVHPGNDLRLECKCIGEPTPTATWIHDGKSIEFNNRFCASRYDNTFILTIYGVRLDDAGTYKCTADNKAGWASTECEVVVQRPVERRRSSTREGLMAEPPLMAITKPMISDITEDTFVLTWQTAIYPPHCKPLPITYVIERMDLPSAEWRRIHSDINRTSFEIMGFDPNKDYMYRVLAENSVGLSDPSSALSVYAKHMRQKRRSFSVDKGEDRPKEKTAPRPPRDKPNIYDVTSNSVCLSWQPAEISPYSESTEVSYILERRCPPRKDWIDVATDINGVKYMMVEYKCDRDYLFRVRAVNQYGVSDPSPSATLFACPVVIDEKALRRASQTESEVMPRVKPRTVWEKPEYEWLTDDSAMLTWKASSCPNYAKQVEIWYIVERREPPNTLWRPLCTSGEVLHCQYELTKIDRTRDCYFRIRAANEVGESEPSMPCLVRRKEVVVEEEGVDTPRKKRSWSTDEGLADRAVPEHLRVIPEFLSHLDDTQYGIEGQTWKTVLRMRAYPEPKVMWCHGAQKLPLGEKFNLTVSPTGELTLELNHFCWNDRGLYHVELSNHFGTSKISYNMDMADPPVFLEPMKDQVFYLRKDGRLECRVTGIPYPDVKFKHDWRVLADSHRIKVAREDEDHWSLNVRNAIFMDEGMYECCAENIAGKVYCTANVKVMEKSGAPRTAAFKNVPLEDYFHVIDEVGRGSSGIVRRVIDKNTGSVYAAKMLRFSDATMMEALSQELEHMATLDHPNIVQLIDGYEDKKRLTLVVELLSGQELLARIVQEDSLTESEVAHYLRQVLLAVEHMHARHIIHLDLKLENVMMASADSDEVKLIDLGSSRAWRPQQPVRAKTGTPEYCAPEVAAEKDVTTCADMWSVGVMTYILLTGESPFHRDTPRDTLLAAIGAQYTLDPTMHSAQALDFIKKCLHKDPRSRLTAAKALDHPFIHLAFQRGLGERIALDMHKAYMFRSKCQRGANTVRTFATPPTIAELLHVSVAMDTTEPEEGDLVPQIEVDEYADSETGSHGSLVEAGARGLLHVMGAPSDVASQLGSSASEWGKEYEDEDTWYEFSAAYQSGADTQLMPSANTALGLRMARYRSVVGTKRAAARTTGGLRERRDIRDLEKEDLPVRPEPSSGRSHKHSIWTLKHLAESGSEQGLPPVFIEKIHDKAYNVGDSCSIQVRVLANPAPSVSWYRNNELLTDGGRVRTAERHGGHYSLTVLSTKPHDFGVFTCVARNKYGKVTCRARMLMGEQPGRPGRPHVTKVSDREMFVIWEEPATDGNSHIQAYRVDWLRPGDARWTVATYCIDECALIKGLKADTRYRFRVAAINKFGLSPYSWASIEVKTKQRDAPPIDMDPTTQRVLLRSRQATSRPSPEPSPEPSRRASVEDDLDMVADEKAIELGGVLGREVMLQEGDPAEHLAFGSEVWRGRFTLVRNVKPRDGYKANRVAKIIPYRAEQSIECLREYEMLKSLKQEHVVRLYEAYLHDGHCVLVLEKLFGENVARSLSLKNKYNEYQVTCIIKQVLDALQFLHHRGIVHLNLQPDNVIMVSRRRFDVKLIDFGRARHVTSYEGDKCDKLGTAEFMAPEKIAGDCVGMAADIWGIGVLAFILLSGVSPFRGEEEADTHANVVHVRYDAHALYHNVTKYALKFIFRTLKRNSGARLTTEEALDHRWLMLNAPMVKARRAAIFSADKMRLFEEDYIQRRMMGAAPSAALLERYGVSKDMLSSDDEDIVQR